MILDIKAGDNYETKPYFSPKFQRWVLLFEFVENRTFIEIHIANFYYQLFGCIGVGTSLTDINADGLIDVRSSTRKLNEILSKCPNGFKLYIK